MLKLMLLILGIGRTGNFAEPKEYPLKLFKKTVVTVLNSDYSATLSEAQIQKFSAAVDKDFKYGKRIELFDISIGLRELRPPFIFIEVHDKSIFRQTGGAALSHPGISVAYMQSTETVIPILNDDPRNGPCGGFNHYSVHYLVSDDIPSLILARTNIFSESIGCVRIITSAGNKFITTDLAATTYPVSKPEKVQVEKCPGQQHMQTRLRIHDRGRCNDFTVEQVEEYWDCSKKKVMLYEFDCKSYKFKQVKTDWQ